MDFTEIRRRTIIALFFDDVLSDELVLKGGNAISLISSISNSKCSSCSKSWMPNPLPYRRRFPNTARLLPAKALTYYSGLIRNS
jgi:hypothetical protein